MGGADGPVWGLRWGAVWECADGRFGRCVRFVRFLLGGVGQTGPETKALKIRLQISARPASCRGSGGTDSPLPAQVSAYPLGGQALRVAVGGTPPIGVALDQVTGDVVGRPMVNTFGPYRQDVAHDGV